MTTALPAAAPYAALLNLLFIALSARVINRRRTERVALGTADDRTLQRATRVHANFAEYVPLALLLMLLVELAGYPAWLLHVLGVALVAGRIAHAVGVSQDDEDLRLRVAGMVLTLSVLGGAALLLLAATLGLG